jgi:cytochrome c-type biogenesis protein CcmF
MSPGDLFLLLALPFAAYCAYNSTWLARGKDPGARRLERASLCALLLLTAAVAYLLWAFLVTDVTILYVWSNTYSGLPAAYKVSGLWAGEQGIVLTLSWLISACVFLQARSFGARGWTRFAKVFIAAASALALGLLILALVSGIFQSTVQGPSDQWRIDSYPGGRGLSLPLQSPEMVLHAPLMLLAYCCGAMLFCASLSAAVTREKRWTPMAMRYARASWLLLTAAAATAAVWAYSTTGCGSSCGLPGSAAIISWLLLTAAAHALLQGARGGKMPTLAPFLGMLSFASMMLLAFVAGASSPSGAHSFAQQGVSAAPSEPLAAGFLLVAICALVPPAAFVVREWRGGAWPGDWTARSAGMAFWSVALICAACLALLVALASGAAAGWGAAFLEDAAVVLTAAVVMALAICLLWKWLGSGRFLPAVVALTCGSVACAIVLPYLGLSWQVGLALPSSIIGIWASANRAIAAGKVKSFRRKVMVAAPQLIHMGACLLLLSYAASTSMVKSPGPGEYSLVNVGGSLSAGEYRIVLKQVAQRNITLDNDPSVNMERQATFDIYNGRGLWMSGVTITNLYSPGSAVPALQGVSVQRAISEDLRLSFEWNSTSAAMVRMEAIPMMSFLWTGAALLIVGIALRLLSWDPVGEGERKKGSSRSS